MSYEPVLPPLPDPRSNPGFVPEHWPTVETALPAADLSTARLFQRAYYAVNRATSTSDPTALAAAVCNRDALDDAFAPSGFLAEPARVCGSGIVRSLVFTTARGSATGRQAPLRSSIRISGSGIDVRDATPIPPSLAALTPREIRG